MCHIGECFVSLTQVVFADCLVIVMKSYMIFVCDHQYKCLQYVYISIVMSAFS